MTGLSKWSENSSFRVRVRVGVPSVGSRSLRAQCQARLPAKRPSAWQKFSTSQQYNLSVMAPTAVIPEYPTSSSIKVVPPTTSDNDYGNFPTDSEEPDLVGPLRAALVSEVTPLAVRFRALFSLKHHASEKPPTLYTLPAIYAIAAALSSPSALLKHELAYCLGQTSNLAAVPFLRTVLEDRGEDAMCRHEAAEALGALGDQKSLGLLRGLRDDAREAEVVRETCEIAVGRIEWDHSTKRKAERLRIRWGLPPLNGPE